MAYTFAEDMSAIINDFEFSTFGRQGSKWALLCHNGVEMKPALHDSVLSLKISNTHGANWHGELRYSPFPVRAGDTFVVSFSARAKHPFTFSVWLGQQDAPFKSLVPEENHFGEDRMTSDWKDFTHTWNPFLDEKSARLNFVFGQIDNIVEIRDIKLTKI